VRQLSGITDLKDAAIWIDALYVDLRSRAELRKNSDVYMADTFMTGVTGLHHVTCIAGDAQDNVDFYSGVLGMRLVKKSVNQDSPGTYHLFYADGEGNPGTDITFFPWPEMPGAKPGVGLAMEVSLAVPLGSIDYWGERLADHQLAVGEIETRRGTSALPFTDPHGLPLVLHETGDQRDFAPWRESPVPVEKQIRGLHSVRLWERDLAATSSFLTGVLGFVDIGAEDEWLGFEIGGGGSGRYLEIREIPDAERGRWGTGGVHHVAWRVPDDKSELEMRGRIDRAHRHPTEVLGSGSSQSTFSSRAEFCSRLPPTDQASR